MFRYIKNEYDDFSNSSIGKRTEIFSPLDFVDEISRPMVGSEISEMTYF